MSKLNVKDIEINVINKDIGSYISITDMLKSKEGDFFVSDWLRNRNTIEFLAYGKIYIILILIMANLP